MDPKFELKALTDRMEVIARENNLDVICSIGDNGKQLYRMVQGRSSKLTLGLEILVCMVANSLSKERKENFQLEWCDFAGNEFENMCQMVKILDAVSEVLDKSSTTARKN